MTAWSATFTVEGSDVGTWSGSDDEVTLPTWLSRNFTPGGTLVVTWTVFALPGQATLNTGISTLVVPRVSSRIRFVSTRWSLARHLQPVSRCVCGTPTKTVARRGRSTCPGILPVTITNSFAAAAAPTTPSPTTTASTTTVPTTAPTPTVPAAQVEPTLPGTGNTPAVVAIATLVVSPCLGSCACVRRAVSRRPAR